MFEPVIGLEIHVQLKTKSKMFCGCSNRGEFEPPNTTVCPVCVGHPGALPSVNAQALDFGILIGLAVGGKINLKTRFDRKNYFYPDLPKGYQISQKDLPVVEGGEVSFPVKEGSAFRRVTVRLNRVHLEEDAAKLLHSPDGRSTLVDFNRGGTPLAELVTEPDLRSPTEARAFLQELRLLMRYLGVSDADMEKGQLRCDVNVSLRPAGSGEFFPKTEIKNVNSFGAVQRALEYEIARQTKLWEAGAPPKVQATRGWDEDKGETVEQRTKEEAHDYRYFPEPDLPPLDLAEAVERLKGTLPELPAAKRARLAVEYGFSESDAKTMADDPRLAGFVEKVMSELREWLASSGLAGPDKPDWERDRSEFARLAAGWVLTKLLGVLTERKIALDEMKVTAENMAELIAMVKLGKVTGQNALLILEEMAASGADPSMVMEEKNLGVNEDAGELEAIVDNVIAANPDAVADWKKGKTNAAQFLVGQVMKAAKGKAKPEAVRGAVEKKLKN